MTVVTLLVASLAVAHASVGAQADLGEIQIPLWGQQSKDGRLVEYVIKMADLAQAPEWRPDEGEPPLKASAAVAIAKKAGSVGQPASLHLEPWTIRIQKNDVPRYPNRWFYIVELYPSSGDHLASRGLVTVVILMNGVVVKATDRGHVTP